MITFNKPINKYILRFHSKHIELSFCELLVFRTKINSIDICAHFYDNHKGIEIISLCNLKEILILETTDVLELKKVLETFFAPVEYQLSH